MTNACANFSSRGLRKKKNCTLFRSFREYFRHAENYFRHCQTLHTSQQRQRPIQYAHARDLAIAAASRTFGPTRVAPGIKSLCSTAGLGLLVRTTPSEAFWGCIKSTACSLFSHGFSVTSAPRTVNVDLLQIRSRLGSLNPDQPPRRVYVGKRTK